MPAAHSRRPSGHHPRTRDTQTSSSAQQQQQPYHQRTHTAPDTPALLRLPSTSSAASISPRSARSRGASRPSSPSLTPTHISASASSTAATSPSYFSPQHASTGSETRFPNPRRPPASFSGHGIDTSRGPPITLITRGNSDIARRTSQQASDFAFAQQQFAQLGLVSPGGASRSSRGRNQPKDDEDNASESAPHSTHASTPVLSRHNSTRSTRRQPHMAGSGDSFSADTMGTDSRGGTSGTDDNQTEDLFLNIAEDSASKHEGFAAEVTPRSDRLRSRIARTNNRQSLPTSLQSSVPQSQSNPATPNATRVPGAIDTRTGTQQRRASLIPSATRSIRDQLPLTPGNPLDTPRSRLQELSPKPSFSSRTRDAELSPKEFLAQLDVGRRRPSYPDATPPNRNGAYRPSNLHYYSSSRDHSRTSQAETPQEPLSRLDGTESHGSTGPATSVWDELDELKTRIRRIELGGKIPATSGAVVSQATADRPRTANTSVTTASSSPQQQRKPNPSPSESTVGAPTPQKVHPLLGEALAKAKQHLSPTIYRVLEATASEAITLAELTGSAGPQGTLHSASSILNGAPVPDRQVRRKADNICRSLTELCIALCETKASVGSPAVRTTAVTSRRPSVQINGDSPSIRPSVEVESNPLPRSSPGSAMNRIEARRVSMLAGGTRAYGSPRDSSQEPSAPSHSNFPTPLNRAGTSLFQSRRVAKDEDDDASIRAPSRAMTDFRSTRTAPKSHFSREYTSREPMPDLQPSPAIQPTTSLRRPTVPSVGNENHLHFRDTGRRFGFERQSSPAQEKLFSADATPRTQLASNRNSIGGISGLGRSVSLSRRTRGASNGE